MPASSIGSDIFALASTIATSLLVLLLLRHYLPLRTTPGYLLLPVFLAIALPCSIVLLVPIDLASSSVDSHSTSHAIWLPQSFLLVCWRISYWLTFVLTWLILPLLGEYIDAGFREPRDRMIYSLRSNARYQLIAMGSGALGLVYFISQNGLHGSSVKGLIMALAYAWGLFLVVGLMGNGLVALPRRLLRNARRGEALRTLQYQAPRLRDKLTEAEDDLHRLESQLLRLSRQDAALTSDMRDWIDELVHDADALANASAARPTLSRASATDVPSAITVRYLADYSRKLKRARHKYARFVSEWQHLVDSAVYLQTVIDAAASKRLILDSRTTARRTLYNASLLTPGARYYVHAYIVPFTRMAAGVIFALASIAIIWSEVMHTISAKVSLLSLTVVRQPSSGHSEVNIGGQIAASAWLLYMCAATLFSLTEIKVWGNRALVKRRTYPESATWYSLQVAKLTVPLSYNFITMLQPQVYRDTAFFAFLGKLINLTPLGSGFSQYFPILILVPVCASLFNLYGRVRKVIGFDLLADEDEILGTARGNWQQGAALIEQAIQNSSTRQPGQSRVATDTLNGSDVAAVASRQLYRDEPGHQASAHPAQSARQQSQDDDDSARHFFQDLGERVRNTFDTADRPQWLREVGSSFKKPKWLGTNASTGEGPLDRVFDGGQSNGRVRL